MRSIKIAAGVAVAALMGGCAIPLTSSPVTHTPPTITAAVHSETPATAAPRSPGSGDGTWLVPSQILPGTYRAEQTGSSSGYVALCSALRCDIMAGEMIQNFIVDGPEYIVIPSYAASVKTQRVTLTRIS